jgi:RHS repeat-associated protein
MTLMPNIKGKYDAWNRLVDVRNTNDVLIATYEYNALNQRIKKTTGSTVTQSFFNENWQELESVTNNQVTNYVWGLRYVDDLVCRTIGTEILYSIADSNWNVIAICDNIGDIQERYTYNAFGKRNVYNAIFVAQIESAFNWNRAFTGQVLDSETGLMLYRNRYYHVELGRFVNRDPIGYDAGDGNLYRYVSNSPLNDLDSYGLQETLYTRSCDRYYGSSDWTNKKIRQKIYTPSANACAFCKLLQSLNGCQQCDLKLCQKQSDAIIDAYLTTFTSMTGTETCGRWVEDFENKLFSRIGGTFLGGCMNGNVIHLKRKNAWWITKKATNFISGGEPGHAAYKITFCNGSVLYFDNGAFGGVFGQNVVDAKIKSGDYEY